MTEHQRNTDFVGILPYSAFKMYDYNKMRVAGHSLPKLTSLMKLWSGKSGINVESRNLLEIIENCISLL